jgi:hypothetical protein
MHAPLHKLIQSLDGRRCALLDELEALSPEDLQARARPDKWSILEIVEHLMIAERVVLGGLPPAPDLVERRHGLKDRCVYPLVMLVLRFPIPVKVPSRRMLPTGTMPLAEIRSQWDETLRWLRSYTAGLDPDGHRRAVFVHPVAGPITLTQALRMDRLHLDRHIRQIRQIRS